MTQQSLLAGFLPTAKSETTSPTWARPSVHRTMLDITQVLSRRATCSKLAVGCVLTDALGRIVGTGYNGVPKGVPHCIDHACPGHGGAAGSDTCIAVHAEQNALMRCAHVDQVINCYVTHAPCMRCTKMLMNTGCQNIWYSTASPIDENAKALWLAHRARWTFLDYDDPGLRYDP